MYSKPEVSRHTGLELLDLMGPVETAYCDLSVVDGDDCSRLVRVEASGNIDDLVEAIGWEVRPDPDNGRCGQDDGVIMDGDECTNGEPICCFEEPYEAPNGDLMVWVNMCCLLECGPEENNEEWNLEFSFFDDLPPRNAVATCDVDIDLCRSGGDCTPDNP
jgi:hypothetical protein